jgi:hypothetical protein
LNPQAIGFSRWHLASLLFQIGKRKLVEGQKQQAQHDYDSYRNKVKNDRKGKGVRFRNAE